MTDHPAEFFKMAAGGNDFIVLDDRDGGVGEERAASLARALCPRAVSVGADGLILLSRSAKADVRAVFFNPDGGRTFCGNGARCAARLAYLKGMAAARMRVETQAMVHRAEVRGTWVSFEMPDPARLQDGIELEAGGETFRGTRVDTGVPHFVVFRRVEPGAAIDGPGRALRSHPRFAPAGTNVDFVHRLDDGSFAIRTFERGVEGETLACGTGCVAAAVAAAVAGQATPPVVLRTRSGEAIRVLFEGDPRQARGVRLEGDARLVYVGQLTDESRAPGAEAR